MKISIKKRFFPLLLASCCALIVNACTQKAETDASTGLQENLQAEDTAPDRPQNADVTPPTEEKSSLDTQSTAPETDTGTEITSEPEITSESEITSNSELTAKPETTSNSAITSKSETSASTDISAVFPDQLSDDLYDFQISIDGTVYQFPMGYSDLEALGWEYMGDHSETLSAGQYTSNEHWTKENASISVSLANLSTDTAAFSDCQVVGIELEHSYLADCGWEILLPGGIRWGVSNADDIKAAYGDPAADFGGDGSTVYYKMTYKYDIRQEINLFVFEQSGVLHKIQLCNFIKPQGADHSIHEEIRE